MNVAGHNVRAIFSRTIDIAPARPAHENNFATGTDDFNIRGGGLGGVFCADDFDGGIDFAIEGAAADGFKIGQAAQLDNFIYIADSLRKPRRRSFSEILRVQGDDGGNFIRHKNKFAAGAIDSFSEPAYVHDFAAEIDGRDRKAFIAAKKNRRAKP